MIFKNVFRQFFIGNKSSVDNEKYKLEQAEKVKKYTDKIVDPSEDFLKFSSDYFTGHPMIRGRGEEDWSVWARLAGYELEMAKQMIFENLGHDPAYIRAIGTFRDNRGIPLLKNLIETHLDDKFAFERLYAAKTLYDWTGYPPYLTLLEAILPVGSSWTKTQLDYWINGIDKSLASRYIFMMLRDEDQFVRWCAYDTYRRYFNLEVVELHERMGLGIDEQKSYMKKTSTIQAMTFILTGPSSKPALWNWKKKANLSNTFNF